MEQNINILRKMICVPIKLYQFGIKPFIKPCCRFYPSCSQYAIEAITSQGICRGLWRTSYRLLRCNPWADGGYDPVSLTDEKL